MRHLVLSQCTRVTDRQTDGQNYDSQDGPRICSRGKNGLFMQSPGHTISVHFIRGQLVSPAMTLIWFKACKDFKFQCLVCVFVSCTWFNVLSQLLVHVTSKNLTEHFPRCTAYNFLLQKTNTMQHETPSCSARKIWESHWRPRLCPGPRWGGELTAFCQTHSWCPLPKTRSP